jgi:hypothetical protein
MNTVSKFVPCNIPRWFEQINYEGDSFDGYYVASWRFFRCSPVERSNHEYVKQHLKDSGAEPGQVIFPVFTDEVMGCRYYVMVREDFAKGLRMADMYAKRIETKGSLDPENESKMDRKGIKTAWNSSELQGRINMCRDAGISIFAARSQRFPEYGGYAERIYSALSEL